MGKVGNCRSLWHFTTPIFVVQGRVTRFSTFGFLIKQHLLAPDSSAKAFLIAEIRAIFERKNRICGVNDTACTKMFCEVASPINLYMF
jgi:hypothetical protein